MAETGFLNGCKNETWKRTIRQKILCQTTIKHPFHTKLVDFTTVKVTNMFALNLYDLKTFSAMPFSTKWLVSCSNQPRHCVPKLVLWIKSPRNLLEVLQMKVSNMDDCVWNHIKFHILHWLDLPHTLHRIRTNCLLF